MARARLLLLLARNASTGKRLFGDTSDKKRLQLTDSKTAGDGITILTYNA